MLKSDFSSDLTHFLVNIWGPGPRQRDIPKVIMDVESAWKRGGGDASPAVEKSAGDVPPEIMIFQDLFLHTHENFAFSTIFKIKWPKSEEKLNFWGRWVWVPMNPSDDPESYAPGSSEEADLICAPPTDLSRTTVLSIYRFPDESKFHQLCERIFFKQTSLQWRFVNITLIFSYKSLLFIAFLMMVRPQTSDQNYRTYYFISYFQVNTFYEVQYPSPGYGVSPLSVGQGLVGATPLAFPNEAS